MCAKASFTAMNDAVKTLFQQLADVSPVERKAFYEKQDVSAAVRAEVESLLTFDDAKVDAMGAVVGSVAEQLSNSHSPDMQDGMCGSYRLVRLLGKGGMGDVYLAERADGEVEHQAAIKFLRGGSLLPSLRSRFLRERQILAGLNHPGIARLLDVGHKNGHPYLVMEYVPGARIDQYATGRDSREILELFLKVCEAVSYAHRNLVIHRDLKPSNIVIDGNGQPKLLDFGIAKILDAPEDTRTLDRMLTPDYASPEQLRGDPQTTATDIYSLGAVLYKLLTGRGPRETSRRDAADTAMKPKEGEFTPPTQVNADIPRDVDHILRKALREEPNERYSSADAFADDVRAILEFRPVAARSGERWYRARKFLRRHWASVSAACIAVAFLTAGFVIAQRARTVAESRFNEVRRLSNQLLDIERDLLAVPGSTQVRQKIVDMSRDYLQRLAAGADDDPGLAFELGSAFLRVGRIQGVGVTSNLGQTDRAEASLREADRLIAEVLAAQPENRMAMLRAAQIAHDRMVLAQARTPNTAALGLARRSELWLQKYLSSGTVDESEKEQVVITGINVANWLIREDDYEAGTRLLRETIDTGRATNQMAQVGAAHIVLARALRGAGDLDGALEASVEAARLTDPGAQTTASGRLRTYRLALALQGDILGQKDRISLGRTDEAIPLYEHAFTLARRLVEADANDVEARLAMAGDGLRLASALQSSDPSRSLALCDEVIDVLKKAPDSIRARRSEIQAYSVAAALLTRLGRYPDARGHLDNAFEVLSASDIYPASGIEPQSEAAGALRARADFEAAAIDPGRGIELYEELLAKLNAFHTRPETRLGDAQELADIHAAIAALHRRTGNSAAAQQAAERGLTIWRHWDQKLPGNNFVQRQLEAASRQ
jgi:tetratricopeptide (TPR) repeat protein/predicted Ser/Thr protein kinase